MNRDIYRLKPTPLTLLILSLSFVFPAQAFESSKDPFEPLLSAYGEAYTRYQSGDPDAGNEAKSQFGTPIVMTTLAPEQTSLYEIRIRAIETSPQLSSMAKADLLFQLQLEWEKRYLMDHYRQWSTRLLSLDLRERILTDTLAFALPISSISAGMGQVPRHFQLFRNAMIGASITAAAGTVLIPPPPVPPPAAISYLALPIRLDSLEELKLEELRRQSWADRAGIAAASGVYLLIGQTLSWSGRAAVGMGAIASPETLGATLALGFAFDMATRQAILQLEQHAARETLLDQFYDEVTKFKEASRLGSSGSSIQLYSSRNLIRAALRLEAYFNWPVLEWIWEEASQERNSELPRWIFDHFLERDRSVDPYFARHQMRETLLGHPELATQIVSSHADEKRSTLIQGLAGQTRLYQDAAAEVVQLALRELPNGNDARAIEMALKHRAQAQDLFLGIRLTDLAKERGPFPGVFSTLFMTAALLRSSGNEFLVSEADQILMDRVRKYAILFEQMGVL